MKFPTVAPLASISPSRFLALRNCILKEALAANRTTPLLPKSPKAALGTACHKLLELGAKGLVPPNREAIQSEWNDQVSKTEQRLLASPMEKHLVPLSKSCNEYFLIRQRAITCALILAETAPDRSGGKCPPGLGHEVEVASADGLLKGRIDCLDENEGVLTLKDYKTGAIFDADAEGQTIRSEYAIQLKLYAAMYAERFSRWPDKLVLVPLSAHPVTIEATHDECEKLADEARRTLHSVNSKIETALQEPNSIFKLASPSPDICRFCAYRPMCPPYKIARQNNPELQWPNDVWGEVCEISISAIGRATVLVKTGSNAEQTEVIRRLSFDGRYLELEKAKMGTAFAFFSLRKENAPHTFTESPMTVIYLQAQVM